MTHLFQNFLADEAEYAQTVVFWESLWASIPDDERRRGGWRCGWLPAQPPKDGNPIFTAVSESQRKAIRVIQYEPTSQEEELDFWFDTFGGDSTEPEHIRELVISCALSVEAAQMAVKLMSLWISGEEVNLINSADAASGA
jgi:hypothetical protein